MMMNYVQLVNNFIKRKRFIKIFLLLVITPFICIFLTELIGFLFKGGNYLGTFLRNIYDIVCYN